MAEHQDHRGSTADPGGEQPFGPRWYGEQDENGVDLSMIRELLRLTPAERLRRADRAEVLGITSSVGQEPRAFWGGYGSSKAAFDTLLGAYADETAYAGKLRIQIIDPGATRTRMRQLAFPGEEPDSVKPPEVVASAILDRLQGDAEKGSRHRVDG